MNYNNFLKDFSSLSTHCNVSMRETNTVLAHEMATTAKSDRLVFLRLGSNMYQYFLHHRFSLEYTDSVNSVLCGSLYYYNVYACTPEYIPKKKRKKKPSVIWCLFSACVSRA